MKQSYFLPLVWFGASFFFKSYYSHLFMREVVPCHVDCLIILQPGCPILHNYLKTTLNPYIINVTLAAKMCSQTLCEGKGACSRKNESSDVYLHLNPSHLSIELTNNSKYEIRGNPTIGDLEYFYKHFQCSCFTNMNCKENSEIEDIEDVNVCTGDNVCIKAEVVDLASYLLPGKSLLFLIALMHILHHLPEDIFLFLGKMLTGAP